MTSTTDILATIVLYNTSLVQSDTFLSLSRALLSSSDSMEVLVYDNSPSKMYTGEIYSSWNIHYHHDPSNSGISKAVNMAGELAKKLGKKWLLILDQDTYFPKNALLLYQHAMTERNSLLFAPRLVSKQKIISPFSIKRGEGKMLPKVAPGKYSFDNLMTVNSGVMLQTADFISCGGYNENFPLDYSDFAFIERYKKIQPYFEVLDLTCKHQFSGINPGDKKSSLNRFRHFCKVTLKCQKEVNSNLKSRKLILKRALRLSLVFKSISFLRVAIQTLIQN